MASIARHGRTVTRAAPSPLPDRYSPRAALRMLPSSDHTKVAETLPRHHQLAALERQLDSSNVKFSPEDRGVRAALWPRCPVRCAPTPAARPPGHHLATASQPAPAAPHKSLLQQAAR